MMREFLDDERRMAVVPDDDDDDEDDVHDDDEEEDAEEGEGDTVYLSPDAMRTLSSDAPPPRVVVIGMLIDRNTRTNRSLSRAEKLMMSAVKLPLDILNVRDLSCREPLNVDTVMELMQRWHWNCDGGMIAEDGRRRCDDDGAAAAATDDSGGSKASYRDCFLDAAAYAMKSQRERHPNRTIHGA